MAETHPKFDVAVVTPDGAAFEGAAELLIVPGAAGEIGVLARHAPLVALLKAGSTRVHVTEGDIREFATGHGFFQVLEDRAIALVDAAVMADVHPKFDVALVTPEGEAFRGEAEMLVVPGAAGEIGVLARHAPLVATLKAGSTRVYRDRANEDVLEFATGPGFFKVELDSAIALVDDAVDVREIDDARAQEQLAAAKAELEKVEAGESSADRWQVEQRIQHAENQLTVSGRT